MDTAKGNCYAISTLSGHEVAFSRFYVQKFSRRACPPTLFSAMCNRFDLQLEFVPSKTNPGGATETLGARMTVYCGKISPYFDCISILQSHCQT